MNKTEICRKLHDMVDQLHDMPDMMWDGAYPMIRLTFEKASDPDGTRITLVAGVETAEEE